MLKYTAYIHGSMANLELEALLSISNIDLKKDLKQILSEILIIVGGEIGAHSGSIMLVNEETGELEMVATFGLPDDYIERVYSKGVPITTSPSGMVLKTGRYYLVSNIFEEPRDKPWMDLSRELGFSSQIFMPMKRKGEVIGLLNIYMANPHEFTESEIAFVTIAASQAAAVIENARLYAWILNKNEELEREIAERKRVEEELCESEEFSSSLLGNSPNPVLVVNPDTSVRYVNPAFEKLTGFSSAELIGRKAPYPWWTEEMLEKNSRVLNEAMYKGAIRDEVFFQKRNGERFWVEITSTPIKKDGGLKYYLSDWVDITDRKRAEDSLRESEEKYRTLFETAKDAIFLADETGKFVDVNQAASESLGYSKEELLELNIREIDADPGGYEEFQKIRGGLVKDTTFEVNQRRKDGTLLPVEINGSRFTSGGKRIALAIARDTTERKQAEEALRESEERYRRLFNGITDAVFVHSVTVEGKPPGKFIEVNDVACQKLGYTREELLKLSHFDIIAPEELENIPAIREKLLAERHILFETVAVTKDGEKIPLELNIHQFDLNGQPTVFSIARDITQRKKAEKEIRKLSSAVEQSIDGIAVGDLELNLTYVNNAFARMHGYSSEEMIGMKVEDLHTKEQVDEHVRCINQIKAQGSWMGEIEHIRKDGAPFPTYMYSTLLKDDDGKPTGILAVVRDITERKQVEEALFKKGRDLQYQINERKRVEEVLESTDRKCREIAEFLPDLISLLPKLWSRELT
jgi:PAS domain S-box-containing protein